MRQNGGNLSTDSYGQMGAALPGFEMRDRAGEQTFHGPLHLADGAGKREQAGEGVLQHVTDGWFRIGIERRETAAAEACHQSQSRHGRIAADNLQQFS